MWPFKKAQKIVTSQEFVEILTERIRLSSKDFCTAMQKEAQERWPLEPNEIVILATQIFIAYLWMVSKALGLDKRVLDLLHDAYSAKFYKSGVTREESVLLANAAQSELLERYEKYYKAWDDDMKSKGSGLALPFEMAQFFFPRHKPVLDLLLQSLIRVHVVAFMVGVVEMRKKYTIVDAN